MAKIILIPSLLLGFAIGAMTAPVVADGLNRIDRVNSAEAWQIERHKMLVSGNYSLDEIREMDSDFEEEAYWVRHKADFEKWAAHANEFLRDVRLSNGKENQAY